MKEQLEQARIFNTVYPLANFEIQEYYQNEPKLNVAYSINNLPKIKDGVYVINLDEFKSVSWPKESFLWQGHLSKNIKNITLDKTP